MYTQVAKEYCIKCKKGLYYGSRDGKAVYIRVPSDKRGLWSIQNYKWKRIGTICDDCLREMKEQEEKKAKKKKN